MGDQAVAHPALLALLLGAALASPCLGEDDGGAYRSTVRGEKDPAEVGEVPPFIEAELDPLVEKKVPAERLVRALEESASPGTLRSVALHYARERRYTAPLLSYVTERIERDDPGEGDALLASLLASDVECIRQTAAELMEGRVGAEHFDLVLHAVADPDMVTAARARVALRAYLAEERQRAFADPDFPDDAHLRQCAQKIAALVETERCRWTAVYLLGYTCGSDAFDVLLSYAGNDDRKLRQAAIASIGRFPSGAFVSPRRTIVEILEDPERREDRASAIYALKDCGTFEDIPFAVKLLASESSSRRAKNNARVTLRRLSGKRFSDDAAWIAWWDEVDLALEEFDDIIFRAEEMPLPVAERQLRRLDDVPLAWVGEELLALLDRCDIEHKKVVINTLGRRGQVSAVPHLIPLLDDAGLAAVTHRALGNLAGKRVPPDREACLAWWKEFKPELFPGDEELGEEE